MTEKARTSRIADIMQMVTSASGPVFEDPEMQRVWEEYMTAMDEYGKRMRAGEITLDNYVEHWRRIVQPKRKAYEDYQTLFVMGVKFTPVGRKGE